MSYAAFDAVGDAIAATRRFLFPFSLGRWGRLALVALFVGGGGGGSVLNNAANLGGDFGGAPGPGEGGSAPGSALDALGGDAVGLLILLVLAVLVVALAFAVVGAIMRFVLLDALRTGEVRIRGPFRERVGDGLRLFGFKLAVGLFVGLPAVAVGAAVAVAAFELGVVAVPILLVLGLLGFVFAVALAVGLGFTTAFVAPVMVAEDVGVLAGWRRFWPTLRAEPLEYVLYLFVRFGVGIVAGIAVGLLVGIVAAVVFLLAAAVAAPVVFLAGGVDALVASPLALVAVALLALLAALVVVVATLFARVPVLTFLTQYDLLVLGATNDAFALVPEARYADEATDAST